MVLQGFYHGVVMVNLSVCGDTLWHVEQALTKRPRLVLQGFYKDVRRFLQGYYTGVTKVLQRCYKHVARVTYHCAGTHIYHLNDLGCV
jgi:hypothetical protein